MMNQTPAKPVKQPVVKELVAPVGDGEFEEDYNDEASGSDGEGEIEQVLNSKENPDKEDGDCVKFTIDMHTLKAAMKRKSAKLVSKLSESSSSCSILKQFVTELNVVERSAIESSDHKCVSPSSTNAYTSDALPNPAIQIDLDSIDVACFARVQFRCESKKAELVAQIESLKVKLAELKPVDSIGKKHKSKSALFFILLIAFQKEDLNFVFILNLYFSSIFL